MSAGDDWKRLPAKGNAPMGQRGGSFLSFHSFFSAEREKSQQKRKKCPAAGEKADPGESGHVDGSLKALEAEDAKDGSWIDR